MKSYFNRFLHHILSHSDEKTQSTPILSYSGLTRISRLNKFANCFDLDTPIKSECDTMRTDAATCRGRSMVEMLGVLAIIGVLSVGAISGYSKAMFKYKLNKHAEQMNTVINAVARNVHSFDNIKQDETNLTPYFIKMGEIPTEMVKANDNNFVYDIFGQAWQILYSGDLIYLGSYSYDGALFLNSSDSLAICQNILTIAQEHSDNISEILLLSDNGDTGAHYMTHGDKYCSEYGTYDPKYCLKNLALDDIYTACAKQAKGGAQVFQISWQR